MVKISHLPCINYLELREEVIRHGYIDRNFRMNELFGDGVGNDSYVWLLRDNLIHAAEDDDEVATAVLNYLNSVGIIYDILVSVSW